MCTSSGWSTSYVTGSAQTATLASYVTSTSLASQLSAYVTTAAQSSTLANYVTRTALLTNLSSYTPTATLNTMLGAYVLQTSLTSQLASYALISSLSAYVTTTAQTTTLNNYVLQSALNTQLASYPTSTALSAQLASYPTSTVLNTTLNSYATVSLVQSVNFSIVQNVVSAFARCSTAPPSVLNGVVTGCVGLAAGSVCTPTCLPSYYLQGPSTITCVSGTWIGSASCSCMLLLDRSVFVSFLSLKDSRRPYASGGNQSFCHSCSHCDLVLIFHVPFTDLPRF